MNVLIRYLQYSTIVLAFSYGGAPRIARTHTYVGMPFVFWPEFNVQIIWGENL